MDKKVLISAIGLGVVGVVVLFLLIQLVPYGRNHTNPSMVAEPNWSSPQIRFGLPAKSSGPGQEI